MADGFGIGVSIVGVISFTIQIAQVVVQSGLDWKDAPHDVKSFMAELQALKTVLSETNTNITLNPDFAEAFQNRQSALLSQLGSAAQLITDTRLLLEICRRELENLLCRLKKRDEGHRLGWERFKGAFLAKNVRESVENLHRQCQLLNRLVSIDTAVLGAAIYKGVKERRKEQHQWHQSKENQTILSWHTEIDYGSQQSDILNRRQDGTGQRILETDEFQLWVSDKNRTLFCPGIPGAGKTILTSIVIDYLQQKLGNSGSVGIAYLYCNFRQEQTLSNLLLSLLKQLVQGQPYLPESVKSLYEDHTKRKSPWS